MGLDTADPGHSARGAPLIWILVEHTPREGAPERPEQSRGLAADQDRRPVVPGGGLACIKRAVTGTTSGRPGGKSRGLVADQGHCSVAGRPSTLASVHRRPV